MALIHYWRMEETSGASIEDIVTNESASVINDPSGETPAPALFGYGRDLSAPSAMAHIDLWPGDPQAAELPQWAISCWFKKTAYVYSASALFQFGNFSVDTLRLAVYNSGARVDLEIEVSGGYVQRSAFDLNLFDGNWHLVIVQCNGSSVSLIVDAVTLLTETTRIPKLIPRGTDAWFGGAGVESFAPIIVDDIAIFDAPLDSAEIATLWNDGAGAEIFGLFMSAPVDPEEPFDDWAANIDPITSRVYYALDVDDGVLDLVRIPISSWQATVQTGRASYAQAVIPAATQWVTPVSDRADGEFIIYRGARLPDGTTQEAELARAPIGDVRFDVGPTNATMTLSGYATLPPTGHNLTRTLHNVRSESTANGLMRVRCDIDWFLRPGHTAVARGSSFAVDYINYYANSSDQYMDVGQRVSSAFVSLLVGQSAASGRALVLSIGASVNLLSGQSVSSGRVLVPDTGA